ncbi:GLPGLI family protein [Chryseobacterium sp. PBS4-4]|uniref:GLPGLI family protein n=1 Tax=Chryseobacterium edaphi TaxID=2976532 RepID=A0ABT2W6S1_9FLAO|nr:GLPGLI family protein [Chryseobacterium edaphi]MCU7617902.1 GLPGLI family protein [Chryseobacterium edaphi]
MKILLLLFLGFANFLFSQNHRFIYEVDFKRDSTENNLTKEFYHLDIFSDDITYYGRSYYEGDSLIKNNIGFSTDNFPKLTDVIVRKANDEYDHYEWLEYDILKTSEKVAQKWVLTNEKKTIQNHMVQKAETNWGGRKWTAWFSLEIPFQYGPYTFHGLPGLIMEISDSKNNFSFKLIKSEKLNETQKVALDHIYKIGVPVNREKYVKAKLTFYNDPLSFVKNGEIELADDKWAILQDGTKLTQKNFREVRQRQQNNMRKYNNPVELNKLVAYPK